MRNGGFLISIMWLYFVNVELVLGVDEGRKYGDFDVCKF